MTPPELTPVVEAYLEAVFELDELGERPTQARLARWFQVAPPTTSEVVHRMAAQGLIEFADDKSVGLTPTGRQFAEAAAARHRVIERYLVDVLGVRWHLADEETRKLEPAVSDLVLEQMKKALGTTNRCPHGNPIPGFEPIPKTQLRSLSDVGVGETTRIDRIREDLELDLPMLKFIEEHGLLPGNEVEVVSKDPQGAMTVSRNGTALGVGPAIAAHVMCV